MYVVPLHNPPKHIPVLNFHEDLARTVSKLNEDDDKAAMFLASVEEKMMNRSMSRRRSMTRSISVEESVKKVTEKAVKKQALMTEEVAETGSVGYAQFTPMGCKIRGGHRSGIS
jgi:hypothetical protein